MGKLKTQVGTCVVYGCDGKQFAWHMCKLHQRRMRKTGRTDLGPRVPWNKGPNEVCIIDGCKGKHLSKGFCQKHWKSFTAWLDKDRVTEDWVKYSPSLEKGYTKYIIPNNIFSHHAGNH